MNEGTSLDKARAYFSQAQRQVNDAKKYANISCDVCGPGGGHTFMACYEAATNAMRSLVSLQNRELAKIVDLKRLVTETAAYHNDFETAVNLIDRMLACGSRRATLTSAPDPGVVAEAIHLTEQFVALVGSRVALQL